MLMIIKIFSVILSIFLWLAFGVGLYFSVFHNLMYWWVFFGLVFLIWKLKINSTGSLLLTLFFFAIAFSVTVFGLDILAEIVMRVSFIGLMIGFIQALREYKKIDKQESL